MPRAGEPGTGFRDAIDIVDHHGNRTARLATDLSVIPYAFMMQLDVDNVSMDSGSVGSSPAVDIHSGIVKRRSELVYAGPTDSSPTELFTIPENSFILGVRARVVTTFDGDATQTFTVGIDGGTGTEFIHGSDFDPSDPEGTTAMSLGGSNNSIDEFYFTEDEIDLEAIWVNTDNETEGIVEVIVWYI